ncbi:TPA: hypothetical protein ACGRG7_001939 [Morganella morganii]
MGIPLREYYPISRAAELLECTVGDLLHWASIAAIKLYREFENSYGYFYIFDKEDSKKLREKYVNERMNFIPTIDGYSTVKMFSTDDEFDRFEELQGKSAPVEGAYPCIFSGLWSIPLSVYGLTTLYSVIPARHDIFFSSTMNSLVIMDSDEYLDVNIDDLYLMKHDFVLIKNNNDKELPNMNNDLDIFEQKESDSANKSRSEAAKDRFATMKLSVIKAAILFQNEDVELFNEKCKKKDGNYNYSAWAREIKMRESRLFEKCKAPVKEDKMAEYISSFFKPLSK